MRIIKSIVALLFLASMATLMSCNTVEGAGKDIESAGKGLSEVSRDIKEGE